TKGVTPNNMAMHVTEIVTREDKISVIWPAILAKWNYIVGNLKSDDPVILKYTAKLNKLLLEVGQPLSKPVFKFESLQTYDVLYALKIVLSQFIKYPYYQRHIIKSFGGEADYIEWMHHITEALELLPPIEILEKKDEIYRQKHFWMEKEKTKLHNENVK